MEGMTPDPTNRALLRRNLNGTFLTADHLTHRHEDEDGLCKLCFQPDNITHRLWDCPAFAPLPAGPMVSWTFPEHDVPWRFAIPGIADFSKWVDSLHQDSGIVRRWSWWELYIDIQLHYPHISPWYDTKTHRWKGNSMPSATPFLKRSRSFAKFVTQYSKHIQFSLPTKLAIPACAHMSLWTNTLPVTVTEDRQRSVDEWLGQFVTGVGRTTDLRSVP